MTRAEQYFSAALAGGGDDDAIVPILIVKVCVRDGRYELAIEYAEPYAQKHPSDMRVRYLLGTLYDGIGAFDRARAELESVIATKPNDAEPHWALAHPSSRRGQRPRFGRQVSSASIFDWHPRARTPTKRRASIILKEEITMSGGSSIRSRRKSSTRRSSSSSSRCGRTSMIPRSARS